jgi:hypothetical protein
MHLIFRINGFGYIWATFSKTHLVTLVDDSLEKAYVKPLKYNLKKQYAVAITY